MKKVSLKAASRAGLVASLASESPCTASRHSSTMPHRLTPIAPPSMRRKLIALEPCDSRVVGKGRSEPRLSDGRIKPRPMRPSVAQTTSTHNADVKVMVPIKANEVASKASPVLTSSQVGCLSASLPTKAIVMASTSPAGSRMVPTCEADSLRPSCM